MRDVLPGAVRVGLLVALLGAVFVLPVVAGDKSKDCKNSQDCALEAREHGKIRPLSDVLGAVRKAIAGEVVKIELEREDGLWVYEIKIITTAGRRRTVEINAETLAIIKVD